jgi:hypothetical protein
MELLKNIVLMMVAERTFDVSSERTGQNVLGLTWSVIDSFCPEARAGIEEALAPDGGMEQPAEQPSPSTLAGGRSAAGAAAGAAVKAPAGSAGMGSPFSSPPQQHPAVAGAPYSPGDVQGGS